MEIREYKKYSKQKTQAFERVSDLIHFSTTFNAKDIKLRITVATDVWNDLEKEGFRVDEDNIKLLKDENLRDTTIHVEVIK